MLLYYVPTYEGKYLQGSVQVSELLSSQNRFYAEVHYLWSIFLKYGRYGTTFYNIDINAFINIRGLLKYNNILGLEFE